MKLLDKLNTLLYGMLICTAFAGCSSDEDGGDFKMSQLVGSEWENKYEWIEEDGDTEKGTRELTFTSSSSAEEYNQYSGKAWEYNYNLGIEEYKPYHGESHIFYNYVVSGNEITLTEKTNEYNSFTVRISGNNLIDKNSDDIWTLTKAGEESDNDDDFGTGESYSWSNMKGLWLEDTYEAYSSTISVYQSQNMSSDKYFNDNEYGNFRVFGMQFDNNGKMREADVQMKAFKNSGRAVLKTIHTSDGKTVYWTDVSHDNYGGNAYVINGDKIYYNGKEEYQIRNNKTITAINGNQVYVKAQ